MLKNNSKIRGNTTSPPFPLWFLAITFLLNITFSTIGLAQYPPPPPPNSYVEIKPVELENTLSQGKENAVLKFVPGYIFRNPTITKISGKVEGNNPTTDVANMKIFVDQNRNDIADTTDLQLSICQLDSIGKFNFTLDNFSINLLENLLLVIELTQNASPGHYLSVRIDENEIVGSDTYVDFPGYISGDIALPVEIISFSFQLFIDKIKLVWQTANAYDLVYWKILRSERENGEYLNIGKVSTKQQNAKSNQFSFYDNSVKLGKIYYYKLNGIEADGNGNIHGPYEVTWSDFSGLPGECVLSQNYPNPFNLETSFIIIVPQKMHVELTVYNILGRRVKLLANSTLPTGKHKIAWNGEDEFGNKVTSGIYIVRFEAGNTNIIKKILLLK